MKGFFTAIYAVTIVAAAYAYYLQFLGILWKLKTFSCFAFAQLLLVFWREWLSNGWTKTSGPSKARNGSQSRVLFWIVQIAGQSKKNPLGGEVGDWIFKKQRKKKKHIKKIKKNETKTKNKNSEQNQKQKKLKKKKNKKNKNKK